MQITWSVNISRLHTVNSVTWKLVTQVSNPKTWLPFGSVNYLELSPQEEII